MAHPYPIWKGFIAFGLVNIPIILYSAEEPSTHISFRQVDKRDGARIKYKRINSETGREVPWEEVAKGYEYTKENMFIVREGELKKIAGDNAKTIAIVAFVDKKSIDFVDIERTFYLEPDKKGEKGYVILRKALKETNKIGIAKIIISTKEYLAAVAIYQDALVVYTLHYSDEMRKLSELNIPDENIKKYNVNNKEIDIAKKLIHSMLSKWKPEHYHDEYRVAVLHWVEEKAKKLPHTKMPQRARSVGKGKTVNFVALLRKSLEKKPLKKMPIVKKKHVARHATRH